MAAIPLPASCPSGASCRSLEAYLVPHIVDVTAGAYGTVTAVPVVPDEVVVCGQTVATLEPRGAGPERERRAIALKAPVTGLVTRRWVSPDEVVSRASPVVSIASSVNVRVLAKFAASSSVRLGGSAVVLLGEGARDALPATIVSIIDIRGHARCC